MNYIILGFAANTGLQPAQKMKIHKLPASAATEDLQKLTRECLRDSAPAIEDLPIAAQTAFTTQALFEKNAADPIYQELQTLAKGLFTGEHIYCVYKPENFLPQPLSLPFDSADVPSRLKDKKVSIYVENSKDFGVLAFAKKALFAAREKLSKEEQAKLSDWGQLPDRYFSIILQKNSVSGKSLHVDRGVEAVFSISIPHSMLEENGVSKAVHQNTFYETTIKKDGHTFIACAPLGKAMITFPSIHPLMHAAPPLKGVPKDPEKARYLITINIPKPEYWQDIQKVYDVYGIQQLNA